MISTACFDYLQAVEIAERELEQEEVVEVSCLNYVRYGYGTDDNGLRNGWWLEENATKTSVPIWVFRARI